MPPPTVKKVQEIPFKHLSDSAKIKITGTTTSPEFRYCLAYPITEVNSKITESRKIPEVFSSCCDVKEIAFKRAYGAGAGSTLVLAGTVPTTILMGAGKLLEGKVTSRSSARKIAESLATQIKEQRPGSISVEFPELSDEVFPYFLAYFKFALYSEDRFRMERSKSVAIAMDLAFPFQKDQLDELLKAGDDLADSLVFMREVADAPPNYCHPWSLMEAAKTVAESTGMEFKAYDWTQCDEMKMGGFCAVSQGMTNEPYFVHMVYRHGTPTHRIALVGKGVCMDTGGYAIKPALSMVDMHHDMGGAACTLSTAKLIGTLKPENCEIHFIMPMVENLVDAQAYLNGDVITTKSGITVFIKNTDAEGRMILCDGITYALETFEAEKNSTGYDIPQSVMTVATLTGAAVIALGKKMAPFYSTSDKLAELATKASENNVDKIWRFPFSDEHYGILNEDDRGDLPNVSKIGAGSVTAAHFLKEFVLDDVTQYMHFDIAGPMTNAKSQSDGYGPFLFTDFLLEAARNTN